MNNGGSITNSGTIDWSQSTGTVSALYDMNGSYSPGTLLANSAWVAPDYSGLVTQITGCKLVNTVQDLQNIESDMSGNYALGHDIDATGYAFKTLGYASKTSFTGQFDGMWHSVSHLNPDISLMGDIAANAVVRDVNLLDASAGNRVPSGHPEGILAMTNHGTVVNAFSSSGVIGPRSNNTSAPVGGLVGSNFGTIARSGSSATVYPDSCGGGLVSDNYGTITQSYATGMVQAIASRSPAAGLADHNVGTISQSFAAGRVLAFNPLNEGGICVRCTVLGSDGYWNK